MNDITQKKLKVVALKGMLQEISNIKELLKHREEKAKAKLDELLAEIQQASEQKD